MFWKTRTTEGEIKEGSFKVLDPEVYKNAVSSGKTQLIDVRTAREFKAGHIANAINIDLFKAGHFRTEMEKLDKQKPVYLYCRSGQRSRKAAQKLLKWGFSEVYDLKGGILEWERNFR